MCGRQMASQSWELETDLKVKVSNAPQLLAAKSDCAPTDLSAVITHKSPREIEYMRWGLIPANTHNIAELRPITNIRSETIASSGKWQDILMKSRCLNLLPSYYEWHDEGEFKVQYEVSHVSEKYVYFAGIWTTWIDRENGNVPVNSFAIPTCEPDKNYSQIHTRMPVAFNKEQRRFWMHQKASFQQLMGLLQSYDSTFLKFKEVGRKRLPKKKDDGNSLF